MPIDLPVYEAADRSPFDPLLLGSGSLAAPIGFMGRDPGRHEVLLGEPFIGAGGRLIRDGLHQHQHGTPAPDTEAAIVVGQDYFWCNTVPYKPLGNKAWSVKIQRRFAPIIADVLVDAWTGCDLLTCGRGALEWFRLQELAPVLKAFWQREDCFTATLTISFQGKALRLHPLPHPSPLNARWHKHFPSLLAARLDALG
jgi:uracil-DNA glycosylase